MQTKRQVQRPGQLPGLGAPHGGHAAPTPAAGPLPSVAPEACLEPGAGARWALGAGWLCTCVPAALRLNLFSQLRPEVPLAWGLPGESGHPFPVTCPLPGPCPQGGR